MYGKRSTAICPVLDLHGPENKFKFTMHFFEIIEFEIEFFWLSESRSVHTGKYPGYMYPPGKTFI